MGTTASGEAGRFTATDYGLKAQRGMRGIAETRLLSNVVRDENVAETAFRLPPAAGERLPPGDFLVGCRAADEITPEGGLAVNFQFPGG